jgi:hypothetical protein
MNKKVLSATKRAYSDSQQFPNTIEGRLKKQKAYKTRNLNWRASESVTPADAVEIMMEALCVTDATTDAYNNFKPAHLSLVPYGSEITLAREDSVCAYVKLPKTYCFDDFNFYKLMNCDEAHVQKDGTIRLWWD